MRRNFRLAALPLLVAVMSLAGAMFCQAADLLDRIKEKKEIVIASEARYAPFEYVDDGKIVGYDVDIFDKMMTALPGVKVTRLDLPFQGLLPGLQTSKFDAIITAITVTAQRFRLYKLSLPIADATFAVVKRKGDDTVKSPDDLAGNVIGTQAGSANSRGAKRFSDLLQAKGLKPRHLSTALVPNEESWVSHSERRPSARFPGDQDGSARENIEPLQ